MKKKLLCVAALAAGFMFTEVKAQTISVGPRLGLNFASQALETEDEDDQKFYDDNSKMTSGIHAGIVFNIGLTDMISVQPEILYSQKGTQFEGSETYTTDEDGFDGSASFTSTETWNYLEIPVLAKLSFGSDLKFFVTAGPTFGYLMSGKYKNETKYTGDIAEFLDDDTSEGDFDFDEAEGLNRMDVGLSVGAGVGVPAGPGTFNLEARYGLGLSNIYSEGDESLKNRAIGVSISYMFPIGG